MAQQDYKECPYCAETIKAEAIKCRYCHSMLKKKPLEGGCYRSRKGRIAAGVCQGLADYLGVPVTVLRLVFIIATVIGGWGIFIYLCLCFLPVEPAPTPVVPVVDGGKQARRLRSPVGKGNIILRLFNLLLFGILLLFVYIPVGGFLLAGIFFVVWGFWLPVFHFDIFRFSLSQLGYPGLALGVFGCLLPIYLLTLLLHLVVHIHFQRPLLKSSLFTRLVFFLCLVAGIGSSLTMVAFQYHRCESKTWSQQLKLAPEQFPLRLPRTAWQQIQIPLRHIEFRGSDAPEMRITYTIKARGSSLKQVLRFLRSFALEWQDSSILPGVNSPPSEFHFAEASVCFAVPQQMALSLEIDAPAPVTIDDKLKSLIVVDISKSRRKRP